MFLSVSENIEIIIMVSISFEVIDTFKEGIYEEIINNKLKYELSRLSEDVIIDKEKIDVEEARKILSTYISLVTKKALRAIREMNDDDKLGILEQIKLCNQIIEVLSKNLEKEQFDSLKISEDGEILLSVYNKLNNVRALRSIKEIRPATSIAQSSLFTGSHYEPNMLSELRKEILTSDHIDMLVSFIKWSGIRCILEELKEFTEKEGNKLRIITTSYMEATDYKAVFELSKLKNTEIKVSYDVKGSRLHAKAYMFKRETGFSTAYIGSSNLSNPALTSGLEWNLKVTEKDSSDILRKFEATFESYWNDAEFVLFNGEETEDQDRLKNALNKSKSRDIENIKFKFDIIPHPYQKEILEKLQVEREVFGRSKNLIVAATGVGKTIIATFDYKRFRKQYKSNCRLLFVAHREEILKQSLNTFRVVLKDFNFGNLLVGKNEPSSIENLFVSIQSFNSSKLYEKTTQDFYDFIIVDEFHHAAARSYRELLEYYKPKILLGLTATPERMDGQNVLEHFDNKIAAEMRLVEAIDRKLLSPFQYFCVTDSVDLSTLKWSRKGYDLKELENVYTGNKIRSTQILNSIQKYVTDVDEIKGLGFCVSKEHALYMADFFTKASVPSIALYADVNNVVREQAQKRLECGEIKFIFVVDLYNEGVDIPAINTVLFLRPTESLTVFVQQLGRGLRLYEDKECLTVLDFVGQANASYNFEDKFRALAGKTKHSIKHYVENGFFHLPKGCFISLEKKAKEYILRNIKEATNSKKNLINKMKYFEEDTGKPLTLESFTEFYHLSIYDVYGKNGDRSFYKMMAECGLIDDFDIDNYIMKRIPNLFHINSLKFIEFIKDYINGNTVKFDDETKLFLSMLYYTFFSSEPSKEGYSDFKSALSYILKLKEVRDEILEILNYQLSQIDLINIKNDFEFDCPLDVHCNYTTSQVLSSLEYYTEKKCPAFREGAKRFEDKRLDIFFITLNKSEKDFSPSTMYEDYAVNERLFHWQSQSSVDENSKTGQRYINHRKNGNKIALFVREYKRLNGYTSPFVFLGTADYVSHSGNKPISFVWELKEEMPPNLVPKANKSII